MSSTKSADKSGRWTINILVFLSFVGFVQNFDLNIKNQIAITAHDCYTRIAIGFRPPEGNDTEVVGMQHSVTDCEDECSRRRNCSAFSYGISPQGNASCIFSSQIPRNEELQKDPDYDVYVKGQRAPTCVHDNLASLDSGGKKLGSPAVRHHISLQQHPSFTSDHGILEYETPNTFAINSDEHWSSKLFPNDNIESLPWLSKLDSQNAERFSYGQKTHQFSSHIPTFDNSHSTLDSFSYENTFKNKPLLETDSKSLIKPVSSLVYFEDQGQESHAPYEQPAFKDFNGPLAGTFVSNQFGPHREIQNVQFPSKTSEYRNLHFTIKDSPRRQYGVRNQQWRSQDNYFDKDPFFSKHRFNHPKQQNDDYGNPQHSFRDVFSTNNVTTTSLSSLTIDLRSTTALTQIRNAALFYAL